MLASAPVVTSSVCVGNVGRLSVRLDDHKKCGLLGELKPGHEVMTDRGFTVEEDLAEKNLKPNIPSFLGTKRAQLTAGEVTATRRIAEARVHVERAIERLKEFEILCGEVELASLHILEQVFQVRTYVL